MNVNATSREAILQACRRIVAERGMEALSMRQVAVECRIALGTLYNYFSDKDALILATVESIWQDIFHGQRQSRTDSFSDCVANLFACIQRGARAYPGFLTGHSISAACARRGEARSAMDDTLAHIRAGMLRALRADPSVSQDTFSPEFSEEAFVGFVLDNLLLLLTREQPDCAALLEIIRRVMGG